MIGETKTGLWMAFTDALAERVRTEETMQRAVELSAVQAGVSIMFCEREAAPPEGHQQRLKSDEWRDQVKGLLNKMVGDDCFKALKTRDKLFALLELETKDAAGAD